MRKSDELNDPLSCMSRARDDEMTFVLLARDTTAPDTIRFWCQRRIEKGRNKPDDPQIIEALACAAAMETDRVPAGYRGCPLTKCAACPVSHYDGCPLADCPMKAAHLPFQEGAV